MTRARLAPSPTGALHLGNARTFLIAWLAARHAGGQIALRIEDIDGPRVKPETIASAIDDLRWLGLDWDEGPDVGGEFGPYLQTERLDRYRAALEQLRQADLVYPCVCTRNDIQRAASAPHAGEEGPRYPGTCRGRFADGAEAERATGRSPAWRLRVAPGARRVCDQFLGARDFDVAEQVGDFVVWKGSGTPAYQLAVVVDDMAMRIDQVVRGDDLWSSTPRQLLLYEALGGTPPQFWHLPLVVGPDGLRLAKRHGDTRISTFRERGVRPERLVGLLAAWCGLAEPGATCRPSELVERFAWSCLPRERIVCDEAEALRRLSPD